MEKITASSQRCSEARAPGRMALGAGLLKGSIRTIRVPSKGSLMIQGLGLKGLEVGLGV